MKMDKLPVALYIRYDIYDDNSYYYSETILDIIKYGRHRNYQKIIACDIKEISESQEMQNTFYGMISDYEIGLETLNNGIIGEDLLFV